MGGTSIPVLPHWLHGSIEKQSKESENPKRETPNRPQPVEGKSCTFFLFSIPEASLPFKSHLVSFLRGVGAGEWSKGREKMEVKLCSPTRGQHQVL